MNRRWLLGGLLAAGGIGLVATTAFGHPRLNADTRLLLIGDSFAAGLGPHLQSLSREEGVDYLGRGVVGSSIVQWSPSGPHNGWLKNTLKTYAPTIVLISLGTNDEYGGCTDGRRKWIESLVVQIEEAGAHAVWIGMPKLPRDETCGIRTTAKDAAPAYFDTETLDIPRGPDRLHPTAAGYAGWSGAIWRWLS